MADQDLGFRMRTFFRQLFGSRLVDRLEEDLMRLRNDYDLRLIEKETIISDLREERQQLRAKVAEYELVLIPLKTGGLFAPKRPVPSTELTLEAPQSGWDAYKQDYLRKQAEEEAKEKLNGNQKAHEQVQTASPGSV